MKVTYTKSEMLRLCRSFGGLDISREDCRIERTDGVDPDETVTAMMRAWYLELLDSAPAHMLAAEDVAAASRLSAGAAGGVELTLPEGVRRVLSVRLEEWRRSAAVLPADHYPAVVSRQLNPYADATADSPVAVLTPAGTVALWPAADNAAEVSAAFDTGPQRYVFDDSAMTSLRTLFAT